MDLVAKVTQAAPSLPPAEAAQLVKLIQQIVKGGIIHFGEIRSQIQAAAGSITPTEIEAILAMILQIMQQLFPPSPTPAPAT
jgi:hypothetical protein